MKLILLSCALLFVVIQVSRPVYARSEPILLLPPQPEIVPLPPVHLGGDSCGENADDCPDMVVTNCQSLASFKKCHKNVDCPNGMKCCDSPCGGKICHPVIFHDKLEEVIERLPAPDVIPPQSLPGVIPSEPKPEVIKPNVIHPQPLPEVIKPNVIHPQPLPEVIKPNVIHPQPLPEVIKPNVIPPQPLPEVIKPNVIHPQPLPEVIEPKLIIDPEPMPEIIVPGNGHRGGSCPPTPNSDVCTEGPGCNHDNDCPHLLKCCSGCSGGKRVCHPAIYHR